MLSSVRLHLEQTRQVHQVRRRAHCGRKDHRGRTTGKGRKAGGEEEWGGGAGAAGKNLPSLLQQSLRKKKRGKEGTEPTYLPCVSHARTIKQRQLSEAGAMVTSSKSAGRQGLK